MTDVPRFRSVLDGFPAYQPGRTPVSSAGKSHKLSSNESPYAPLPSVVEVIAEEARSVNRYPDNGAQALIGAIAERFSIPANHVAVGCGSVGVTQQLLEAIGEPGAEVMYAWRSFEAYHEYIRDETVPDGVTVYRDRPNVAVLRTFSKAYGLAGLRTGFMIAHEPVAAAVR